MTGTNHTTSRRRTSQPMEHFTFANKGNEFGIEVTVARKESKALSTEGKWSAETILELRNRKYDDSFESRYRVVTMGGNSLIALPVYLSWDSVGVTRETMELAMQGVNYRGSNELGELEITGAQGIGRITLKKSSTNLHSAGWVPLSKVSGETFPNGLKSIEEEYSFSPERRFGDNGAFRCVGTRVETIPDGRKRRTELDIQVTEQADSKTARRFIDAIFEKLPNNKRIVTGPGIDVATVLDDGKQKVVLDRDVERVAETRFKNSSTSSYYYGVVIFFLALLGFIGYLRWSQKTS